MAKGKGRGLELVAAIAAGAAVVLALLVQCAEVASPEAPTRVASVDVIVEGASPDLTDWIDAATGCAYLVHRLGGVTPRLNAAGKPLCRGVR